MADIHEHRTAFVQERDIRFDDTFIYRLLEHGRAAVGSLDRSGKTTVVGIPFTDKRA